MRRSANITTALLLATMCIPIVLSVAFFMGQSLRLDESQSLWQTSRTVADILAIVAGDVHVPLYHILLHFWLVCFGNSVSIARSMSLLLYVVSIPALYLVGRRAYSRTIGLFAAFLFAISPFMNWYGNEIRMYTLFTLFVILNQYFFIRLFQEKVTNDRIWVGYILTAVLGTFSHYFFFLVLAGQMVFYFMRQDLFPRGSLWRFAFTASFVVLAFVPWGWYVYHIGQAGFQEPNLPAPTTVNLFSTFSQFMFGFQNDNVNTFFLSLWPVTVILGLLTLRRSNRMLPETEYFLTTILVSFAIAFFGSFVLAPVFVSRYLIFTVPSLYLVLASLLNGYSRTLANVGRLALAGVMVGMLWVEVVSPTTPVKENYAQASDYLTAHTSPQDIVILSAPFTIYPVQYYYRGPAAIETLPVWDQYAYGPIPAFSKDTLPAQVTQLTHDNQNVYVLLSYDQGYEHEIKDYFDTHYQRIYQQNFSSDLTLYVYRLRYDTTLSEVTVAR